MFLTIFKININIVRIKTIRHIALSYTDNLRSPA